LQHALSVRGMTVSGRDAEFASHLPAAYSAPDRDRRGSGAAGALPLL
jgi:hypothetical protein